MLQLGMMITFRATLRLSMLSAPRRTLQNRGTRLGPGRPPLRLKFSASTSLCHGPFGNSSSSSLWQHPHCQLTWYQIALPGGRWLPLLGQQEHLHRKCVCTPLPRILWLLLSSSLWQQHNRHS